MTRLTAFLLARCQKGVTVVEFAMLAPAMIVLIAGSIEAAHFLMVKIALEGALSTAARESIAKLNMTDDARDQAMRDRIGALMMPHHVAQGHNMVIETKVYRSFGSSYPEAFQDVNGNGAYDPGEPFDDRNRNGVRDTDAQVTGKMGGVGDVVSYRVTFPTAPYFNFLSPLFGSRIDLISTNVARNEPEAEAVIP